MDLRVPFVIAFALAAVLTGVARRVGLAVGLVDRPVGDPLKIHARPIPLLGGVSVVGATIVGAVIGGATALGTVTVAVTIMLVTGLLDDIRPLPPPLRLAFQAMSGVVIAAGAIEGMAVPLVAGIGVVLLTMACTNATNLLDGMDGLAAGLGITAALGLTAVEAVAGHSVDPLQIALAGSLVGFLLWNRPPARIFLGNNGAYAVGIVLAIGASRVAAAIGVRGLFAAGFCLSVFAIELASTIGRRIVAGRSPSAGDRDHAYDRLARRWQSPVRSVLAFWALGAVAAGAGTTVAAVPTPVGVSVSIVVAVLGAASVFALSLGKGRASLRS